MGRLTIVGLGPAGPELITPQTRAALESGAEVRLRTARHPAAEVVVAPSFDEVYESADRFADVYAEIRDRLQADIEAHGHVVYAVPGSPLVLEHSVALLREVDGIEIELLPAVSFLDLVWARLGLDPFVVRPPESAAASRRLVEDRPRQAGWTVATSRAAGVRSAGARHPSLYGPRHRCAPRR